MCQASSGLIGSQRRSTFSNEPRTPAEKREYLRHHRAGDISVSGGCELMSLSRSTFYDRPPAPVAPDELVARIGMICDEFECYGYRRVGAALRQQGIVVNGEKLRRLMREHDLQPKRRRRYVITTDSDHAGPIFPDLAKRRSGRPPQPALGGRPDPRHHFRAASSTWLRFSMPDRARSSAMRSVGPWAPALPSRH